ncbi:hypothetical protein [Halorarum halobium]|uniref:hypothetical protein n=1 Tax=Halorarum halobium TaxID=3075121 RepID=UPI0028A5BDCB|nr:hypothetical protein [Halobaculum sp. XH14]
MDGITTHDPAAVDSLDPEVAHYTVKRVSGETVDPRADAINSVACFGDTATGRAEPDRLAVDADGDRASSARREFDWNWLCPTDEGYRDRIHDCVDRCVAASPDVRLLTVGFPGEGFCRCERCTALFDASEHEERTDWRAAVITEFVEDVADRVPGEFVLTAHPDPYPGHLRARRGLDLARLDEVVDGFLVPLCDPEYATTYWLETIARGFSTAVESPVTVQLSSTPSAKERFEAAAHAVAPHVERVVAGGTRETLEPVW